jgi:hypothetical protein
LEPRRVLKVCSSLKDTSKNLAALARTCQTFHDPTLNYQQPLIFAVSLRSNTQQYVFEAVYVFYYSSVFLRKGTFIRQISGFADGEHNSSNQTHLLLIRCSSISSPIAVATILSSMFPNLITINAHCNRPAADVVRRWENVESVIKKGPPCSVAEEECYG